MDGKAHLTAKKLKSRFGAPRMASGGHGRGKTGVCGVLERRTAIMFEIGSKHLHIHVFAALHDCVSVKWGIRAKSEQQAQFMC